MKTTAVVAALILTIPQYAPAQPVPDVQDARTVVNRWFALVRQGAAEQTWAEASNAFRARIVDTQWREWVRQSNGRLPGSQRRELEFTLGHDEPPLAPLTWVRMTVATDRPAGGRVLEQIVVWHEVDRWRVAHYGAWVDDRAAVAAGAFNPIPYQFAFAGQHTFRERHPWWVGGPRHWRTPPPPPSPSRPELANRVLPRPPERP